MGRCGVAEKLTKQKYCSGCRDDFYNHGGHALDGKNCWMLRGAKVVTRYRIGYWTAPTQPGAFDKVTTLNCHYAPGKYAHITELPNCVTSEERKRIKSRKVKV
jgi:hypothetical protein